MLDLFSDNSIKTIVFAQEEARNKNLNELSPIDMFIGILRNKECNAYKIIYSQIDIQERFFEKNKSLKENLIVNGNIEIGLNKDAKKIISDAIYERNIASAQFHFKTKFINSIKLLKSILNSKEKNLLLFFDDNKINYEELLNKVNKKVIEDWMGSDINQEEFFRYLNVESLNEEGEWIFEGTYTNHLAFKIAYSLEEEVRASRVNFVSDPRAAFASPVEKADSSLASATVISPSASNASLPIPEIPATLVTYESFNSLNVPLTDVT